MSTSELFLPDPAALTPATIRHWYLNVQWELSHPLLETGHRRLMAAYYREVGLLRRWRRPFFLRHFCRPLAETCRYLLTGTPAPRLLELGCGFGGQTLLMALLGAHVTAVDADPVALEILEKRRRIYERLANRPLRIETHCGNSLEFDYQRHGPFDGAYSVFAFNMMQPSSTLLTAVVVALAPQGRLAILDGNKRCWLGRLARRGSGTVWAPHEFRSELESRGFRIDAQIAGPAVPPVLWALDRGGAVARLDSALSHYWSLPVSHLMLAGRSRGYRTT